MPKEYVTYVRQVGDLRDGELELFIRDLTPGPRKYDARHVRARISSSADVLPDADTLWVRSETGVMHPRPWAMNILEELPPYVRAKPWTDVFAALGRG